MDLILMLLANIIGVALLVVISIWLTNYNMAWWLRNQRAKTITNKFFKQMVFLRIRLPKEVHKSPAAMEIILNALNQGLGHKSEAIYKEANKVSTDSHGKATKKPFWKWRNLVREEFYLKYLQGSMRLWSSLEIVSEEGQISFYVMTQPKNVEVFKAYTYSQYPGIEISEVDDYTLKFKYVNPKETPIYVGRYILPPEKDFLPIKTYVDYGLDKDPKEEYKIDPLTPLLEAMSAAGPGENFWFQVLIRPTTDDNWKKEAESRIDKILGIVKYRKDDPEVKDHKAKEGDVKQRGSSLGITPSEKHELEILQKNLEKPGFDCIIRMLYVVDKKRGGEFNLNKGVFTVVNAMKSFNKPGYNTFGFKTITIDTDTPFLDPTGLRSEGTRRAMFMFYKLRTGFYHEAEPFEGDLAAFKAIWHHWVIGKSWDWAMAQWGEIKEFYGMPGQYKHKGESLDFVLNMEELATIWHFPGKAFGNSTGRVESTKSDPPTNLPI